MKKDSNILLHRQMKALPYPMTIHLIVADDPAAAYKTTLPESYEHLHSDNNETLSKAYFLWSGIDGPEGYFFLPKNFSAVEIGHECFHAAHRTMDMMGDKFSPDNHEAVAYLQQDIATWIITKYKDHGLRVSLIAQN